MITEETSIKIGDTVKIIGTTVTPNGEAEPIPIGTICTVIDSFINKSDKKEIVCVLPTDIAYSTPYAYYADAVEKGHLEWVKD